MINAMLRDVHHSCRMLWKRPVFSLVVIFSLAIGIGANAAIFNLATRLLGGALPIEEPERVVALHSTHSDLGAGSPLSFPNWVDVRDQSGSFSEVAGYEWSSLPVTLERGTTRFASQLVSGNYFETLGVKAVLGRTFSPAAARVPGAAAEVVVSHHFWRQFLQSDPAWVGRGLNILGHPFTVVGVADADFSGIDVGMQVEFWIPIGVYRQIYSESDWVWYETRRGLLFYGLARLRPDVSLTEAQVELDSIAARLQRAYPEDNEGRGVRAMPVAEATIFPWARPFIRNGVLLLTGAALLTLTIAVVNVVNLLLARTREREKEVAIRLALGVSRVGLANRLMIEAVVLALLGGLAGLGVILLTQQALQQVISMIPSPTASPLVVTLALDPTLLLVTFGGALTVGVLLGLFPSLKALRVRSSEALRSRGLAREGRVRRWNLRSSLLVVQLALSVVTLLGSGLFIRSLSHIQTLDPGFEARRLAFMRIDLSTPRASEVASSVLRRRIVSEVARLPGVEAVGVSPRRPMDGGWQRPMAPAELAADPSRQFFPYTDAVDGAFFDAMGLALVEGRSFTPREQEGPPRVAIVNEQVARRLWPGETAVGRSLVLFDLDRRIPLEVVGVVEGASYRRVTENPAGYVYMPLSAEHSGFITLAIRTSADPEPVLGTALRVVRDIDATVPILESQTVSDVLQQSRWAPRLGAAFLGIMGLIALVLSAVGIYGVIAFDVSRRVREFCIRVAVGARPADIRRLVLGVSARHYLAGAALGIPLAYAASMWVSSLIFVARFDAWAGLVSFLPLLLVGLIATLIPARRATALDPNEVLRSE